MITKEDLSAALRLLTFDTIYGLFKWQGGTFRFETKPVSYDQEFVEPLNSEYLLLDVLRMVDEWPMIAERLPSFDMVLQKINPMATLDILAGTPWEKSRTFQMEVIYDLIDGQRAIKEIIDLSFVEEFETCKNLINLMDAGLIELDFGQREEREAKGRKIPGDQTPGRCRCLLPGRDSGLIPFPSVGLDPVTQLSPKPRGTARMARLPGFSEEGPRGENEKCPGGLSSRKRDRSPEDPAEMVKKGLSVR